MSEQKLKAETITIVDLVREAITIPDGWHEEIYVEPDGSVTFCGPFTQNTWTAKADASHERPDNYIGDLHSLDVSDFEGFRQRSDGFVEINDPDNESGVAQQGEYYPLVEIVDLEEAIYRIIDTLDDPDATEWGELVDAIQTRTEEA